MDDPCGRAGSVALEDAVASVAEALAAHGPVAVFLGSSGGSEHRLLAGEVPSDPEAAATVVVRTSRAERELRIVAPTAPPATLQLAVLLLTAVLERDAVERDVADQRRYEQEARTAAARFETLVAAAPDAIVVVDHAGRITDVNPQATHLFGYEPEDLVGLDVDLLLPDGLRAPHAALRRAYVEDARARPMGAGRDLEARRADGSLVPVDIGLAPIAGEGGTSVAAFVRDATPRRRAEADRQRITEAQMRRRQALELNDTVVQGLVSLLWRLDDGETAEARRIAEATLQAARRILTDLLSGDLSDLDHDHLVRSEHADTRVRDAATLVPRDPHEPGPASGVARRSVLIADDAAELRFLLRLRFERSGDVRVVAEAEDGQQAIDLAREHRPDVVLLDLSMPVLDGLAAAERIRAELPATHIVVLSGYPREAMGERALAAGADSYCEKTASLDDVYAAVAGHPVATPRPTRSP